MDLFGSWHQLLFGESSFEIAKLEGYHVERSDCSYVISHNSPVNSKSSVIWADAVDLTWTKSSRPTRDDSLNRKSQVALGEVRTGAEFTNHEPFVWPFLLIKNWKIRRHSRRETILIILSLGVYQMQENYLQNVGRIVGFDERNLTRNWSPQV